MKKRLQAYTLIIAIVVTIVVTAFSLMLLSFFNINYSILNRVEAKVKAELYCYDGLEILGSLSELEKQSSVNYPDGFSVHVQKKMWGFFRVFSSIVQYNRADTLFSKTALIGRSKDRYNNISLFLRNSNSLLSIGDSVHIFGTCLIPKGMISGYRDFSGNRIVASQIQPSPDSLIVPFFDDSLLKWISDFFATPHNNIIVSDSIFQSFEGETIVLSADTVWITGKVVGNVVVSANRVIVENTATLRDVVLIAKSVRFPDFFRGRLQVFVSDSVSLGKSAVFEYPSVVCLLPDVEKNNVMGGRYIHAGDSLTFMGEIYAYSRNYFVSQRMSLVIGMGSKVTGSLYSSGSVTWSGALFGNIVADRVLSPDRGTIRVNHISKSSIDTIPSVFGYSVVSSFGKGNTVVTWLQ